MQLIQFAKYPDSSFIVELDSQLVTLRLTWNEVDQSWYMEVSAGDSAALVGLKLVPNYPIMDACRAESPIAGDFICYRLTAIVPERIDYDALGVTWGLCWLNDAQLKEWMVAYGLG